MIKGIMAHYFKLESFKDCVCENKAVKIFKKGIH